MPNANQAWFAQDRFGLFIHWGSYSLAARHEWVKHNERIPDEIYEKYFRHFDPDLYDPSLWAKAASSAGMKYFVVTTKHHEGFCLWDTAYTDYKAPNTPYGKDVLTPMVEAFRRENMKVGFYHSLLDWHHPEYTLDECHPMRDNKEFIEAAKNRDLKKYTEYLHNQTTELLTKFGKVDVLWYDFSVGASERYPGKGKEEWESEKLIKLIRSYQPDIILNDRLQIGGDVVTPEQYQPREWVKVDGKPVMWEACQTFSGSWGYHRDESTWKSVDTLIQLLIDTVSKGGNLLLNVGPTGRGEFDYRALSALEGMGKWMKYHSRAIYNCTEAPEEFTAPRDTRLTYNPDKKRLYIHMYAWPFGGFFADSKALAERIEYAQLLNDASELRYNVNGDTLSFDLPVVKPNVTVPVIEVFLK
ncbi:alpha-L-fucosidase [Clostridia bacterium]|nr:alpha-L-fucosidase [Clostridia bacterium]